MTSESTFQGYVTISLTVGLQEETLVSCSDRMVQIVGRPYSQYAHGEGKEWHRSRESAVNRLEEMRSKKIDSLQKKIAQLKELKFQ